MTEFAFQCRGSKKRPRHAHIADKDLEIARRGERDLSSGAKNQRPHTLSESEGDRSGKSPKANEPVSRFGLLGRKATKVFFVSLFFLGPLWGVVVCVLDLFGIKPISLSLFPL